MRAASSVAAESGNKVRSSPITSSFTRPCPNSSRPSRAVVTASSTVLQPAVFGSTVMPAREVAEHVLALRLREVHAPQRDRDHLGAARLRGLELERRSEAYLPLPTIRRERNSWLTDAVAVRHLNLLPPLRGSRRGRPSQSRRDACCARGTTSRFTATASLRPPSPSASTSSATLDPGPHRSRPRRSRGSREAEGGPAKRGSRGGVQSARRPTEGIRGRPRRRSAMR